jgi:PTS system galactitol-specific IIA component
VLLQIDESLILVDVEAPDAETVINLLADRLQSNQAVGPNYAAAPIEREKEHSTGLPTRPFCIAFPHAGMEGVNISSLAVANFSSPVLFNNMADPEEQLPVEMVFLLANNNPEEQVQALRNLALIFGEPEKLEYIRALTSPARIASWLQTEPNSKES